MCALVSLSRVTLIFFLIVSLKSLQLCLASDTGSSNGDPFSTCFDTDVNGYSDTDEAASESNDGVTPDKSPGIGVEFETSGIVFKSSDCSQKDTFSSKGKLVDNRRDPGFWNLTADTTFNAAGYLTAEYILDGKNIRIGSGKAQSVAASVAKDLVTHPHSCRILQFTDLFK